jgi:FMN-dependent NADH-azoreductase
VSSVFRLDSSIRTTGSVTRALATDVETELGASSRDIAIVRREIGTTPLPSSAWAPNVLAALAAQQGVTPTPGPDIALARTLGDEMERADGYIIAAPFYNFGVSQHLKTWFDLLLTDPRFSVKSPQLIAGRPAVLVVARGGAYGPQTPRFGWDHATGWLKLILENVWGLNLRVLECELTLADVNPAMAELRPLAAQNLQNAHALAKEYGQWLASELRAADAAVTRRA